SGRRARSNIGARVSELRIAFARYGAKGVEYVCQSIGVDTVNISVVIVCRPGRPITDHCKAVSMRLLSISSLGNRSHGGEHQDQERGSSIEQGSRFPLKDYSPDGGS